MPDLLRGRVSRSLIFGFCYDLSLLLFLWTCAMVVAQILQQAMAVSGVKRLSPIVNSRQMRRWGARLCVVG